jgi:hypothetical protein
MRMTASLPAIVLVVAAAIGLAGLIAWVAYNLLPEKVLLRNQTIVKKYRGKIEQMPLSDVSQIRYHYHAVVGFVAVWEFIDKNAASLSVDAKAKGVDDVLSGLEKFLPGFSLAEFKRKFGEGDVEDAIDVWKAG